MLIFRRTTSVATDSPSLEPHHRFHSYCARFPSAVAETAITEYSRKSDSVLDPFCGSGTTLVAGLAYGRSVIGADVDVLAGMLSEVKCEARAAEDYERWRSRFAARLASDFKRIEQHWCPTLVPKPGTTLSVGGIDLRMPGFPELNFWFPPQLAAGLGAVAEAAHDCRDAHFERVALVSLSAAIIAKWPNTLSYAMDIDHTRPHRRVQRFQLSRVLATYLRRLDRTIACLGAIHDAYPGSVTATQAQIVYPHDARKPLPGVESESQALVVTSPPYFNAVDYPRAHRMAVCWMNGHAPADLASRADYIGLHGAVGLDAATWLRERPRVARLVPSKVEQRPALYRRLAGFFSDLSEVLKETKRVLRPGGRAVFVIGDNLVKGQRIASHAAMVALAEELGFEDCQAKPREIVKLRRRYPVGPFGFDGPMTHEYVVTLGKGRTPRARSRHGG